MDQGQVDKVGAGLVGGAKALAGFVHDPVVQVQADQEWFGEPVLKVGPVLEEPVVEVAAGLDRLRCAGEDLLCPGEVLLSGGVLAPRRCGGQGRSGHRWSSSALVYSASTASSETRV